MTRNSVPPFRPIPELTLRAVLLGAVLSAVMAAANAYLGLFAGMTVCASIPAAVVSMGLLGLLRKSSILENNLVQTAASAGESLAAGVIFTLPALVLMGFWQAFRWFDVFVISGLGGFMGVLFTVVLRRALIIEAGLKYPEGVATAEVLKAGERGRAGGDAESAKGLRLIGLSALAGGLMKLGQQGLGMWQSAVEGARSLGGAVFGMGMDVSPALVSVGFIVGRDISILVFAGGVISWVIAIPLYSFLTGDYAAADIGTAYGIWNSKIRYLGVGAMVTGGINSIVQLSGPLLKGLQAAYAPSAGSIRRETGDIPLKWVLIGLGAAAIPLFLFSLKMLENLEAALALSAVMLVFGFMFTAVAGYMAGLVGSSNNPVSGITIATILFTSLLLLAITGTGSLKGAAAAVMTGAVICCAAAISGDTMQDLKAGQIVGASPWKQQLMQLIGVVTAALVLGFTLNVLHSVYVIGSETLSAPQATLMRSVAEGVFKGGLPWNFVLAGVLIGVMVIGLDSVQKLRGSAFRFPLLAVAVGIYLPVTLSVPIFLGGMLSHLASKRDVSGEGAKRGLLTASGLITGEALMGIGVAVPVFITARKDWWPQVSGFGWTGIILLGLLAVWMYRNAISRRP